MNEIKNLLIEGTEKTPRIDFNQQTGELVLLGKSIPENASKVYEPLIQWINGYVNSPQQTTNLRLNLEYFNSATAIWFAKIVRALSNISEKDSILIIHLYFDVEDFNSMDMEELNSMVGLLVDNLVDIKVSIGIKAYGLDYHRNIVKETTIFV